MINQSPPLLKFHKRWAIALLPTPRIGARARLAKRCGLSQTMVSRIWRAFGLQPHRVEGFKLSKDPFFVEKVRDIVGLYLDPPDKALVLCVDEKALRGSIRNSVSSEPLVDEQSSCLTNCVITF